MGTITSEKNRCINCKRAKNRSLAYIPVALGDSEIKEDNEIYSVDDDEVDAYIEVLYEACRNCNNVTFLSYKEELVDSDGEEIIDETNDNSDH